MTRDLRRATPAPAWVPILIIVIIVIAILLQK